MSVEYRWDDGGWARVSGLGGVDTVTAYLRQRFAPRIKRGAKLEVRDVATRGRPRDTAELKDTWIQLRVTVEQKRLLAELAAAHKMTLTEYMLKAASVYKGTKS